MTPVITVKLDGHANGNYEPSVSLADDSQETRDEAFRADLASRLSAVIGTPGALCSDFDGNITVTWTNNHGNEVVEET